MKRLSIILSAFVLVVSLFSCDSKGRGIDGGCYPEFKFSPDPEKTELLSSLDSIVIEVNQEFWWFSGGIFWNGKVIIDSSGAAGDDQHYHLRTDDFSVERLSSKEIKIIVQPNKTLEQNKLLISVQAADCYGNFTIYQQAGE